MPHSDFTHLHLHTQYSLLDGACRIPDLLQKAKSFDMDSLAITDHGNMFGAIEFYLAAQKCGIKPIIGCELYITTGSRLEKTASTKGVTHHIVLLARDETGYQNLMKLGSAAYLEGFYYDPRIDKEILARYSKGLIGLSACLTGEVSYLLNQLRYNDARAAADSYKQIFGENNFFLEVQINGLEEQNKVNKELLRLSQESGIGLLATNDVHYLTREPRRKMRFCASRPRNSSATRTACAGAATSSISSPPMR